MIIMALNFKVTKNPIKYLFYKKELFKNIKKVSRMYFLKLKQFNNIVFK